MITQTVTVTEKGSQNIIIGRRNTYGTEVIVFDLSYLIETFGNGSAILMVKRSGDVSAYPAVTEQNDNRLSWSISDVDTSYKGHGECELFWYVDEALAKSVIYDVTVLRDIGETTETPPDPYQTWVDTLTDLGAETLQNAQDAAQSAEDANTAKVAAETAQGKAETAQEKAETAQGKAETAQGKAEDAQEAAEIAVTHYPKIVNSYWYVWQNGQWVNTGVKAEGSDGREIVSITCEKTGTSGLVDTYTMTITYNSGNPDTVQFLVTNGEDGYNPVVTITTITGGHRVTITDKTHPDGQSFDVTDGINGVSPEVTITEITGGHRVTITDEDHPLGQSFDVMDGTNTDAEHVTYDDTASYSDGTVGKAVSHLNSAISLLDDEVYYVSDAIAGKEDHSTAFVYQKDGTIDIVLNGPATGPFDGSALIDGVNIKCTSLNGQTTNCNAFFISGGQVNKANGQENFISDILPVSAAGDVEKINGRSASSALEVVLLKTKCNYTVDAANAYFQAHPIRVWFQTPNYATATSFYYCINCAKSGFFLNIGTTQAVPQLSSGDTLGFGTGTYSINGNTGTVSVSADLSEIQDGATVSSNGNLSTVNVLNLQNELAKKVSKDGWSEVQPINTTFFDGVNYFDLSKSTVYNDRFVGGNGTITASTNVTSIVFPVKPDTTYWFFAPDMNRFFVVENDSYVFNIGSTYTVLHALSETQPTEFTTGHTAKYVFVYFANYNYDFTQKTLVLNENHYNGTNNPYVPQEYLPRDIINPLTNANVLIFGDSITDTCNITVNASDETTAYVWRNPSNSYIDAGGTTVYYNMWPYMLQKMGIFGEIRNYALSGASYQDSARSAGNERQNLSYQITVALNDLDNPNNVFEVDNFVPDIVIFALGTNDGDPDDTYADAMARTVLKSDGYSIDTDATLANLDRSKFCEAARSAFLRTRIAFPEAQFYCVLPIQRANNEVNGQNLNTYLREMARRYGCVIIDGYAESGIIRDTNVWNALGATLKDGLHPNDKGQNMMFRMIYSALKSHYIKDDVMNP